MIILTGAWLLFNVLFFWTNSIIDSYFYWAFAHFLQTGTYPFAAPFIYARPTTISPPLYSALLLVTGFLPHPDILIRLFQTALLAASGYLLFRILEKALGRHLAEIASCLFILIPGNTVFADYLLTETLAQFFVILLAYLLIQKKISAYGYAIILTALATLSKYSLIIYAAPAGLFFFRKKQWIRYSIYPVVAAVILAAWVFMNWQITGVVGLSDTKGIQLYNQIVWIGQTAPRETSAAMKTLRRYVPASINIKKAYWDLQGYILPHVGNSWPAVDKILGAVAFEAVREHPLTYAINTVHIFIALHGPVAPYWINIGDFGKIQGPYPLFCGKLGTFLMCAPVIRLPGIQNFWDSYISFSTVFYRYAFSLFSYAIFFPSLFLGLFSKSDIRKKLSFFYFLGVIPIAMYVHPDTRYILPFYPLYAGISALGLQAFFRATKRLWPANGRRAGGIAK